LVTNDTERPKNHRFTLYFRWQVFLPGGYQLAVWQQQVLVLRVREDVSFRVTDTFGCLRLEMFAMIDENGRSIVEVAADFLQHLTGRTLGS